MNKILLVIIAVFLLLTAFFEVYDFALKFKSNQRVRSIFKTNRENQKKYFEHSGDKIILCTLEQLKGTNHGNNLCELNKNSEIEAIDYNSSKKMFINESGEFV